MTFAIIKTGGKQHLVKEGVKIKVEKLEEEEGKTVTFSEVLLTDDGKTTTLGAPIVPGAKVTGKVLKQGRKAKITVLKFRNKSNSRSFGKYGHRQPFTEVEINSIG